MGEWVDNPERYRKLSEPIGEKEADEALQEFAKELETLREKYRMPELICAVQVYLTNGKSARGCVQFGNMLMHEPIAAYCYSRVASHYKAVVDKALKAGETEEQSA